MKALLICGKTGGHFYPAIAVGEIFREKTIESEYLVTQDGLDFKVLSSSGEKIHPFKLLPKPINWSTGIIKFLFLFLKDMYSFRKFIKENAFDIVMGFGGNLSVAPLFAAKWLGVKTIIHEPNVIWGQANKWLRRIVDVVTVAHQNLLVSKNIYLTGVPIRKQFLHSVQDEEALLKREKKTILIIGGSQGAQVFNEQIPAILKLLSVQLLFEVIHITGGSWQNTVKDCYEDVNFKWEVLGFCNKFSNKLKSADLIISRAGASVLAEIAACQKAAILIPYPFASDNHQYLNALAWEKNGAGLILKDEEISSKLPDILTILLKSDRQLFHMSSEAKKMNLPDAAYNIWQLL